MKHSFLIIYAIFALLISACDDAKATSTLPPPQEEHACKLVEGKPVWSPSTLCKEGVSKGMGVTPQGNWKAQCVTLSIVCEAEK